MSRSVPSLETPSQQYEHQIATELDSRGSSSFRGDERTIFQFSDLAYEKLLLHTYKYPQQPVNGVLLGASYAPKTVTIRDAVPLQHNGMEDRSMMEVALEMVRPGASRIVLIPLMSFLIEPSSHVVWVY